jgi:hypothetical protein
MYYACFTQSSLYKTEGKYATPAYVSVYPNKCSIFFPHTQFLERIEVLLMRLITKASLHWLKFSVIRFLKIGSFCSQLVDTGYKTQYCLIKIWFFYV